MKSEELKNLLVEVMPNDLTDLFRLAKAKIRNTSERHNQIVLIESNFKQVERSKRVGETSDDFYSQTLSKIRSSILALVNEIQEDDLVDSFVNEDSLKKYQNDEGNFEEKLKFFGLKRRLKSSEGLESYQVHYTDFLTEFDKVISYYSQLSNLKYNSKNSGEARIYQIEVATIRIVPCVDNAKKLLWIGLDFEGEKNKQSLTSLGVFKLDYTPNMELVWRNEEDDKLVFTNKQLAEIVNRKVFDLIMTEE